MDFVTGLFAATFVLMAILAWSAIRARGKLWRKLAALGALAVLVPLLYIDAMGLMGRPKPITMEWFRDFHQGAVLVGADIREGVAIYIWLRHEGEIEPRAYVLDWDRDTAVRLKEAADTAQEMATDVMVRLSKEDATIEERSGLVFYAEPQPALPEKPPPDEPGMIFQPSVQPAP